MRSHSAFIKLQLSPQVSPPNQHNPCWWSLTCSPKPHSRRSSIREERGSCPSCSFELKVTQVSRLSPPCFPLWAKFPVSHSSVSVPLKQPIFPGSGWRSWQRQPCACSHAEVHSNQSLECLSVADRRISASSSLFSN